eukprot:scaffold29781_cov90-Isochrysis_galbana.AAC.1
MPSAATSSTCRCRRILASAYSASSVMRWAYRHRIPHRSVAACTSRASSTRRPGICGWPLK